MPTELEKSKPQTEITNEEFAAAVSSPDCRGRIQLRCGQMLEQEISDIAEDSQYPLNSVSEVVRFCCLTGLPRLRQWKPAPTLLGAIKAANALMIRDKMQCDATDLIQRLDERVQWYIANRHFDEIIDLVAKVHSYFAGITDDFWASYIRDEIDAHFIRWMDEIDAAREKATVK